METKSKQKIIIEGLIRSFVFLITLRFFYMAAINIVGYVYNCFCFIFGIFGDAISFFLSKIQITPETEDIILFISLVIAFGGSFIFSTYICAKFSGIYKYLSNLNRWKKYLILIILSIIIYYFYWLEIPVFHIKSMENILITISIIPSYWVYVFFNFLAKKFPMPFEKIGNLVSLEFYINIFKKLQKK